MKCFDCNHINEKGSKFCSNCGKDFKAKSNKTNENSNYPDANSVKMHEDRLKERAYNPARVIILYLLVLVVVFFITGGELTAFAFIAFILFIFALSGIYATKRVTEDFYYTLPSSKDINGNHRCIFCGNKGIYKSTIYRTNTTRNCCSKCSKELFLN